MSSNNKHLASLKAKIAERKKRRQAASMLFKMFTLAAGGNVPVSEDLVSEILPLQEVKQGPQWDNLLIDIENTPESIRKETIKALVFKYLTTLDLDSFEEEMEDLSQLGSLDAITDPEKRGEVPDTPEEFVKIMGFDDMI